VCPPAGVARGPSWSTAGSRSARNGSLLVAASGGVVLTGVGEEESPCIRKSSEDGMEAADGAAENGNTDSSKMTWREMIMRRVDMSRQR